jgi:hypothetical protein
MTVVRATVGGRQMQDQLDHERLEPLSHDSPCVRCGHPAHLFLPCENGCDCEPTLMPGEDRLTRDRVVTQPPG